jgi:hypothetical protein
MKHLFSIVCVLLLAGCSAPKYVYRFPASPDVAVEKKMVIRDKSESNVKQEIMVASADPAASMALTITEKPKKNIPALKEAVRELKKAAEKTKAEIRSVVAPAPGSLDEDLKMAILFGVVGAVSLVLLILSKLFGILGGIALIIATVYFVKWVLAQ